MFQFLDLRQGLYELSPCVCPFCSISLSLQCLSVLLIIYLPVSVCFAPYLSPCICLFCSVSLSLYLSVLFNISFCICPFCSISLFLCLSVLLNISRCPFCSFTCVFSFSAENSILPNCLSIISCILCYEPIF